MKQAALEHPSAEWLAAFGLGQLNESDSATIEQHITVCEPCRQAVDSVAPDSLVGLLKASPSEAGPLTEGLSHHGTPTTDSPAAARHAASESATLPPDAAAGTDIDVPADLANHPRYRIQELLGTGGMGSVYKAEHRLMRRHVALKVINPKFMQSKHAVERFRREVEAAARLHHPNIVTAHDAEQAGDLHYLVMEYVPGTDLGKVLEERGPLPISEACEYIRQAALGLQHAHEKGMVHRDIKPQNLMVVSGRVVSGGVKADAQSGSTTHHSPLTTHQVKILDFGLASLITESVSDETGNQPATLDSQKSGLTQAGSLMGTPDYMAPEQARDARTADIRSDIYSLGCTLYCLLTGKVPYPGGTAIDKVLAHNERKPQSVRELRKDVPPALLEVLDKMMAKNPAERQQTPAEAAEDLAGFAAGRTAPRAVQPMVAAPAWALAVSALAAFVCAAGIGVWLWLHPDMMFEGAEPILPIMGVSQVLYAVFIATAALLMSRLRLQIITGLCIAVLGMALPLILAVNVIRGQVPFWPMMLSQMLGVPVCLWALMVMLRQEVREAFTAKAAQARFWLQMTLGTLAAAALAFGSSMSLTCLISISTDSGRFYIESKVGDVQVVVSKGGNEFAVIDVTNGSKVTRLPSGTYEVKLKGNAADVTLSATGFTLSRHGQMMVKVTREPALAAGPSEPGWTQLFNGKNQNGWNVIGGQPGAWNVVEGLLVGNAGPLPFYTIDRTYSDFHLRMEARINVAADLGLYFRLKKPGPSLFHDYFHGYGVGIQAPQMGGNTGGIIKGLKQAVPPAKKVLDDETLHEFFIIDVIARKNRFIVKVNGETTADVTDPDNKYPEGYFGLRLINAGTHVMIRKIEIKELPAIAAANDEDRLQGTWRPVAGEYAGKKLSDDELKGIKAVFKGETLSLTVRLGNQSMRMDGPFSLDPHKEPKRMIFIIQGAAGPKGKEAGAKPNTAIHGIYRFDGDRLVWCLTEGADRRPNEFATSAKTPDQFLLTLERQESRSDNKLLQGAWKAITFREDGKEATPQQLATVPMTLTIAGNQARLERAITPNLVRKLFEGALQLEETQNPKRLRVISPPDNKTNLLAIYDLQGDKLSLCHYPLDRNAHPSAFTADAGSGATLMVFQRVPVVAPSVSKARSGPDKDLILGTWKPESAEIFGDRVPQEIIEMLKPTVTFTADKVIWKGNPPAQLTKALEGLGAKLPIPQDLTVLTKGLEGVYHLEPTKSPKSIDLVSLGPIKKTMLGIYTLEGSTLKLCLSFDPERVDQRPTEFATKAGVLRGMVVLKRE